MVSSQAFIIWGEEDYLIDQKVKNIISEVGEVTGEEPEKVILDADELGAMDLAQSLEFSPLFTMNRVVIIKKPYWLGKLNRKARKVEEIQQVFKNYFSQNPDGQTLIVTFNEHHSTNPIVKLFNKEAQVINCKKPDNAYLTRWIKEKFTQQHREIDSAAVQLLVRSEQDMYYLDNLIEKICLIINNRTINEKDINDQLDNKHEISVFRLTDTLLSRNLNASLKAYYQLIIQGQSPVFLLYMIVRQFIILGQVKYYIGKGFAYKQIATMIGQKEFAVRKIAERCSNFSWEELRILFNRLLETDAGIKTSSKDMKLLMEILIIEICSKK